MPFANIKISGQSLNEQQCAHLHDRVTHLIANVLGKKLERTVVMIDHLAAHHWSIAAQSVNVAAHLEVTTMPESNTVDEKARFMESAHKLFEEVLGPELSPITFVVFREVPADDWGFGGKSNAYRAEYLSSK